MKIFFSTVISILWLLGVALVPRVEEAAIAVKWVQVSYLGVLILVLGIVFISWGNVWRNK